MFRCLMIATIVLSCDLGYAQSRYLPQHFDASDGLASAYVQSIVQDSLGFLWIQYPGGLTRFDGYEFKLYKHDPENPAKSPGDGPLLKIMTDHDGNVWLLGEYNAPYVTIAKYNRNTDDFTKYKIRLTNPIEGPHDGDAIRAVRFERSGDSLWLATRSGLYSFNIHTQEITYYSNDHSGYPDMGMGNYFTDISVRDSFLLLSSRNGLWKLDKKRKHFSRPRCDPEDSAWLYQAEIWEICEAPNYDLNDVWLVGNDGFRKVNEDLSLVQRFDLPGGLYGFGVFNYVRDKTGAFWVSSITKGLHRYDPANGSFLNVKDMIDRPVFEDNVVNSAFIDRDENIWVATDNGITKLRKPELVFYNHDIPKGDSSVVFSGIHASLIFKTGEKDHLVFNHYKKNDNHEILTSPIIQDRLDSLHLVTAIPNLKGRGRKQLLAGSYRVLEAVDGKKGVNKAVETVPDLIISDIMMPGMDGYKLCEHIRRNEITSHIPVILLTAKADRESKLGGLEIGSDDYLSKPFDVDELKLIIRNRIEERRKMRERFSRELTLEPRHIAITSMDENFLKKVLDIMELHMNDESFSVGRLSEEAGFSHIQFYRKIKALSGESPNQFLKTIRLKRAAQLLRSKSDNVAQIAYSVGFGSQSYFIKCFKEQFGVTPGEYMQKP